MIVEMYLTNLEFTLQYRILQQNIENQNATFKPKPKHAPFLYNFVFKNDQILRF